MLAKWFEWLPLWVVRRYAPKCGDVRFRQIDLLEVRPGVYINALPDRDYEPLLIKEGGNRAVGPNVKDLL